MKYITHINKVNDKFVFLLVATALVLGGFFVGQKPAAQAAETSCTWQQAGDVISVPATASTGAHTPALDNGVAYRLTASGTYSFWTGNSANPQADAEFADTTDLAGEPDGWNNPKPNAASTVPAASNLELLVDGKDVDWLSNGAVQYNPDH